VIDFMRCLLSKAFTVNMHLPGDGMHTKTAKANCDKKHLSRVIA